MRYFLFTVLILSSELYAQNTLRGKVLICKSCGLINIYNQPDSMNNSIPSVKTSFNKKGELETEVINASYKIYKDDELKFSGDTDSKGNFEIESIDLGSYKLNVRINRFLNMDTLIRISKKRTTLIIEIQDHKWRAFVDSIQMASQPFNADSARNAIKRGDIYILDGLHYLLSVEQSDSITLKYGFKYRDASGCLTGKYLRRAVEEYNAVVYEYLDSINEDGWREKVEKEYNELVYSAYEKLNAR